MYTMIQAGSMGIPFTATLGYAGTDIMKRRPNDFKSIENPFDPDELIVVAKAMNPDVAIIHGLKGDRNGNILVQKQGEDILLAQASQQTIASVEEIVDHIDISDNEGWMIPGIYISAVVYAPYGAHPTGIPGVYDPDENYIREYIDATASDISFTKYLDDYVFRIKSHREYMKFVGLDVVSEIMPR